MAPGGSGGGGVLRERVGRDAETAGGASARPAPALSDGTQGPSRGPAAEERPRNKCGRGSGGGDAGPGADSRSEVHHKYKRLKLQKGKKRLLLK